MLRLLKSVVYSCTQSTAAASNMAAIVEARDRYAAVMNEVISLVEISTSQAELYSEPIMKILSLICRCISLRSLHILFR